MRRLKVLVDKLPPESATKTAARDALTPDQLAELMAKQRKAGRTGYGPFSHTDMKLAAIYDMLGLILHVLQVVNSRKGQTVKAPKPYPRPGVPLDEADRPIKPELLAVMERMRADHRRLRVQAGVEDEHGRRVAMTPEAAKALQQRINASRAAKAGAGATTGG